MTKKESGAQLQRQAAVITGAVALLAAILLATLTSKLRESSILESGRPNHRELAVPVVECTPSLARESPWIMLRECTAPHHALLSRLTAGHGGPGIFDTIRWDRLFGIAIFGAAVIFAVFSIKDVHGFVVALLSFSARSELAKQKTAKAAEEGGEEKADAAPADENESAPWSVSGLILLTIYRFYTGFLSATWLPYLLAMEGQYLWKEKQALFMALAKLIYALSILMNPVFGLVGDEAVAISHGVGRRLFIRIGLTLAAVGLYICVLSGRDRGFMSFLSGITVWRFGEALNDVTTEALVPDLVSKKQFQIASAIKASSFLLGGLFGYALLIIFADAHYSWLYYAYPIGMFVASLPPLYMLNSNKPVQHAKGQNQETFMESIVQAYISPLKYPGGFPYACLAVFVFSLGTAPMFFLLLIVRDLVGITDPVVQQQQFSLGSIVFFLSAAASSCLSAMAQPKTDPDRRDPVMENRVLLVKGRLLVSAMITFGIVEFIIPGLALLNTTHVRNSLYYVLTVLFGAAFGAAFTLFQDLTWQLLPTGVRTANAMGFNVMSRLFGVGVGNFACGMMLDLAYSDDTEGYKVWGYVVMHTFSGLVVLLSVPIANKVISMAMQDEGETTPLLKDPSVSGVRAA